MVEIVCARDLLRQAGKVFASGGLAESARLAWRSGFRSGGCWMGQALQALRGTPLPGSAHDLNVLGLIKYGLALAGAVPFLVLAWWLRIPLLAGVAVLAFYAIEAQMVFLFPLVLDGEQRPFRASWLWTRHAGGTLAVMRVVLPLAGTMLLGGFLGKGLSAAGAWAAWRSVCGTSKYDGTSGRARLPPSRKLLMTGPIEPSLARWSYRLEFGAFRPPAVRRSAWC